MADESSIGKRLYKFKSFDFLLYIFMIILSLIVLYPFLYLIALSFNQGTDAIRGGITVFPRKFTMENYRMIFENRSMLHGLFISISRTLVGTAVTMVFTILASYCFTKRDMVGYKFYLWIFLIPMYIAAGIIPTYLVYKTMGITNNFLVYIIPNLVWGSNIIIMRTLFDDVPKSLAESAFMDGAGDMTIIYKVIVPLSLPVIATIALFNAVWQWNSWFDTMLFTRSKDLDTLMSLLSQMLLQNQSQQLAVAKANNRMQNITPEVLKAAMTMITVMPIVLVYPFLQKYFIKGIMVGAVKE